MRGVGLRDITNRPRGSADPTTKIAEMLLKPSASEQRLRRRLDRKAEEMRALKDCLMALRADRKKERAAYEQKVADAERERAETQKRCEEADEKARRAEDESRSLNETLTACHAEIRQVHTLHQASMAERQAEIEEWKQLAERGTDDLAKARTEVQDMKEERTTRNQALAAWQEIAEKGTKEVEASRIELSKVKASASALKKELILERSKRAQEAQVAKDALSALEAKYADVSRAKAQMEHELLISQQKLKMPLCTQSCAELRGQLSATRRRLHLLL